MSLKKSQPIPHQIEFILRLLFGLIVLTGSLNLFYKFPHLDSYVQGWLVDYLIPKIYLSDFFIIAFLVLVLGIWLWQKRPFSWQQKSFFASAKINRPLLLTFIILVIGLFLRQFTALVPVAAFFSFFKLLEFGLLALALYQVRHLFTSRYLFWLFFSLLIFQSLLGCYQFITQKPLFPYYIFGETNLSQPLGLPRFSLFSGPEKVMPYGTFPHPNILAGITTLSFLMLLFCSTRLPSTKTKISSPIVLFISAFLLLITLFLTQSLTALATLIFGLLIFFFYCRLPRKSPCYFLSALLLLGIIPLAINFISLSLTTHDLSLTRRADLQQAAIHLFLDSPLEGTGLNQFVPHLPAAHPQGAAQINFHQPVHNLPLLLLSETGLLGFSLLISLCFLIPTSKKESWLAFFIIIPIISLDHYFLTTQSGLLFFLIALLVFPQLFKE